MRTHELAPDGVRLIIEFQLVNTTHYPLNIRHADYTLACHGSRVLSGFSDLAGRLEPGASADLAVPVFVRTRTLLDPCPEADDAPGDTLNGRAEVRLHITVGDEAEFILPGRADFDLPVPQPPCIELVGLHFDALGWNQASGRLELALTNRCLFDVDLGAASLALTIGPNVKLRTDRVLDVALAPAGRRTVSIPIHFSPANHGYNAFAELASGDARYQLQADVAAATPWGPLTFACDGNGCAPISSDSTRVSAQAPTGTDAPGG